MNEREIFMAAIHIEDQTRCEAYLDQVCGEDHNLRNRVQVLLQAHRQAEAFLESPADDMESTAHMQDITESTGEMIGN